jgi:hypothetical protein
MHNRTVSAPDANRIRCTVGMTAAGVGRSDPGDRSPAASRPGSSHLTKAARLTMSARPT